MEIFVTKNKLSKYKILMKYHSFLFISSAMMMMIMMMKSEMNVTRYGSKAFM